MTVQMYAVICRFPAGECFGADLMPVWEQIRTLMECAIAAVYRSCNDRQKIEYAALNKEVKLEKREFWKHLKARTHK